MKYSKKIDKGTRMMLWGYYDTLCIKGVYSFESFCKDHLNS